MKLKHLWTGSTGLTFPPARAALRELYRATHRLHFSDSYASARLARIADQTEYFLQAWPAEQWPEALHSGQPLPARNELLKLVTLAKAGAASTTTASQSGMAHHHWQQVMSLLLSALAPFA